MKKPGVQTHGQVCRYEPKCVDGVMMFQDDADSTADDVMRWEDTNTHKLVFRGRDHVHGH